jgi:hypothetical protein
MNKYFIAISEPGMNFSGERLTEREKINIFGMVIVHNGKFYVADRCMNGGFITITDQSGKEESKQVSLDEISLLKTIEKETFVEVVRKMRENQRNFFKSKPDSEFRRESLNKSKAYEKQVDLILEAMADTQLKLM